ncbi:hypothetical protein DY218_14770 [Streptomyces triticagri]|uniref:Uncharacterized protein n=1 Tax=Streptomyces triticagri TaxID=2293568 RepID=A0A372M4V3_9ACTN|nr:hypothetical protein [Streptomyces triticagri]RFU85956.1 hypothetical protein DY218_14770 [Streptomyces triticagri]
MSDESTYPWPRAIVLDDTAALALGGGNRMVSRFVVEAEKDPTLHVYIPVMCLAVAERERAGVAEHVGSLPSVDITEMGFDAAAAMGKRVRIEAGRAGADDWGGAHALHLGLPSVEWPRGRPILTREPGRYRGTGVRAVRIEG